MPNWTIDQLKAYTQKRLKDEERARTKLYANHTQKLSDVGRDAVQSRPVASHRQESKDELSLVRCNMQKMPAKQTYNPQVGSYALNTHLKV